MSTLLNSSPQGDGDGSADEQLVAEVQQVQADRSATRLNRRRLVTNLGLAAGAAGMLGVSGCTSDGTTFIPSPTTTPSVLDILNFALNLEYFEASYYSYIVTGTGLSAADMGTGAGTATGGAKINFQYSAIANIAANLMTEEVLHVEFLRATIAAVGGTPVPMPNLNLAALGAPTNDATFVALSRTIEGVGVSAYAGGAQYLTTSVPALNYAAQILSVEAQHAGALRQTCIYFPSGTAVTSPAADALDMPPTASAIFNTSKTTGLNPVRTISQVLGIVYGQATATTTTPAAGITKGGFFPNGFNGDIFST